MKRLIPLVMVAGLAATSAGCYGSYGAFKTVHRWNGHATGNAVANSAIHLGLWILPVYPLCLLGDFFIFNNVEFISGNPVFK
jgi:hypothetical protein